MTDPTREFEQMLRTLEPRGLSDAIIDSIEHQLDVPDEPPVLRLRHMGWMVGALGMAACAALAASVFWFTATPTSPIAPMAGSAPTPIAESPPVPIADSTPTPMTHSTPITLATRHPACLADPSPNTLTPPPITLASGWTIQPTGKAAFTVVNDRRIRLDQGELYVQSNRSHSDQPAAQGLVIETPEGEAHAQGTRFYVGSHTGLGPLLTESKGYQMKRMTRILVLAGTVTLSTSLGSVTGSPNDLLAAEPEASPIKLTVESNTDFALRLYHRLAADEANAGKNLFFSPYSISNALVMTMEGARGTTMSEMGDVLGFPDSARRLGRDAQNLPWETSLMHTGFSKLNKRYNREPDAEAVARSNAVLDSKWGEWERAKADVEAARSELALANAAPKAVTPELTARREAASRAYRTASRHEYQAREAYNAELASVDHSELRVVNALWGEQSYPFDPGYVERVNKFHETGGLFPVNFIGDPQGSRAQINQWVEDQTSDRIQDLIKPEDITSDVRLVLTNTIYFKGDWALPFDAENTKDLAFRRGDGASVTTPIMSAKLNVQYAADYEARGGAMRIVALPYKGEDLSMVLVQHVSDQPLIELERTMTGENLDRWLGMLKDKKDVDVTLPRFKMESSYNLKPTLIAMGMPRAFGSADFSGMDASGNGGLRISAVVHKGFIEVNEKGSEAAAATGVVMIGVSGDFDPVFDGTRPFIYLIRDNKTNSILFIGRMMDPTSN